MATFDDTSGNGLLLFLFGKARKLKGQNCVVLYHPLSYDFSYPVKSQRQRQAISCVTRLTGDRLIS